MNNLVENIGSKEWRKLLDIFESHTEKIKKGKMLPKNVKPKEYIGIVLSGLLRSVKNDYNGNKIIVEEYEENDLFGNMISPLSNNEYEIIAADDSQVIIIDFDNILNAKTNTNYYHIFQKNLMTLMAKKIRDNNLRIDILTNKTIRNKLLEYFRISARKNNSNIIYLPFTFTSLADYLAIDRCAMSREIKNLKNEGLIEVKDKRIKLLYYIQ